MVLSILICLWFVKKMGTNALINLWCISCHNSGVADSNRGISNDRLYLSMRVSSRRVTIIAGSVISQEFKGQKAVFVAGPGEESGAGCWPA